eukprot:5420670-Alexandrium_andersonii.AAC.1
MWRNVCNMRGATCTTPPNKRANGRTGSGTCKRWVAPPSPLLLRAHNISQALAEVLVQAATRGVHELGRARRLGGRVGPRVNQPSQRPRVALVGTHVPPPQTADHSDREVPRELHLRLRPSCRVRPMLQHQQSPQLRELRAARHASARQRCQNLPGRGQAGAAQVLEAHRAVDAKAAVGSRGQKRVMQVHHRLRDRQPHAELKAQAGPRQEFPDGLVVAVASPALLVRVPRAIHAEVRAHEDLVDAQAEEEEHHHWPQRQPSVQRRNLQAPDGQLGKRSATFLNSICPGLAAAAAEVNRCPGTPRAVEEANQVLPFRPPHPLLVQESVPVRSRQVLVQTVDAVETVLKHASGGRHVSFSRGVGGVPHELLLQDGLDAAQERRTEMGSVA